MVSLCFERATYLHRCLKIEAADDIENHNFQNEINEFLEKFTVMSPTKNVLHESCKIWSGDHQTTSSDAKYYYVYTAN